MLIYLYFVTSNFSNGLNWLFSCLPEGVKPLGKNPIFPRLRPYTVINSKMGVFQIAVDKSLLLELQVRKRPSKEKPLSD